MRDEPDLQGASWIDALTEKNEWECMTRQSVFAEIRHDRRWGKAGAHLRKTQTGMFSDKREITENRESESKTERIALYFRDADQRRSSQCMLERQDARGFAANLGGILAGALAANAEDFATGPDTQDSRAGPGRLSPQLGEHGVHHFPANFVAVAGILQCKRQNFAGSFDLQTRWPR